MKMKSKYWMVLAAACGLAASAVGVCMNTAGLFYSPIAADLGVGRGAVALTSTILSVIASFSGMITPRILKTKTLKPIIIIGTVLMAGSTALYALCPSLALIYILSAVKGFGVGMCNFVVVTMLINNWFRAHHGTFTSLAMTFSGVPGLFLSPVFTSIISTSGWRKGYLIVALSIVLFNLPAILFPYTLQPKDCGMVPFGQEDFEKHMHEQRKNRVRLPAPSQFSMMSLKFLLAALFTASVCMVAQMTQHFPSFAESKGFSSSVGALMLSVSMAGSVSCKLVYGSIADKLGNKLVLICTAAISGLSTLLLMFSGKELLLHIGSFLFTMTAANSSVGLALITSDLFGVQNYSKVYPTVSFIGSMTGAFAGTFFGLLYDMTKSYNIVLIIAGILQALVILSVILAYAQKNKEEKALSA